MSLPCYCGKRFESMAALMTHAVRCPRALPYLAAARARNVKTIEEEREIEPNESA